MNESNIEEKLEQVLDRVIDWLKYEEAQNAALLTLDRVGLGVILQWLGTPTEIVLAVLLKTSQAALLVSLLIALSIFVQSCMVNGSTGFLAPATLPKPQWDA